MADDEGEVEVDAEQPEEEDTVPEADADLGEEEGLAQEADEVPPDGEDFTDHGEAPEQTFEDMIEALGDKFVVKMRQKLGTAELASEFCTQLIAKIDEEKAAGKTCVFEDFDISQNVIATENLETIFSTLADGGVQVERFRCFGCPTLNSEAMELLAGWLSGVTEESMPYELHLSDCAITTDGYKKLVQALEGNDAFPGVDPKNPSRGKLGLYVRLENNYVDKAEIQASIDEGTVATMTKEQHPYHSDTTKMRILLRSDGRDRGSFMQKEGEPPAPEDAPPPKRVNDWKGGGKGKGKGGSDRRDRDDRWSTRSSWDSWKKRDSWNDRNDRRNDRDSWSERRKGSGKDSDRDRKGSGKGKSSPPWQALPDSRDRRERPPIERRNPPPPPRKQESRRPPLQPLQADKPWGETRRRGQEEPPSSAGKGSSKGSSSKGGSAYDRQPYNAFGRSGAAPKDNREQKGGAPAKRSADVAFDRSKVEAYKKARPTPAPTASPAARTESARPTAAGGKSGKSGKAADGKGRTAASKDGKGSGKKAKSSLPHPWEEHWSDEYKLTYFWNSSTGESSWERPSG
jgi:hypothetical protein